jgi:hypothetical protein
VQQAADLRHIRDHARAQPVVLGIDDVAQQLAQAADLHADASGAGAVAVDALGELLAGEAIGAGAQEGEDLRVTRAQRDLAA